MARQLELTWRRRRPRRRASTLRAADVPRLDRQRDRVAQFMRDGAWHSLREIAAATASPEASASARLRQLRAAGHVVERRREGDPRTGAWRYRLRPVGGR